MFHASWCKCILCEGLVYGIKNNVFDPPKRYINKERTRYNLATSNTCSKLVTVTVVAITSETGVTVTTITGSVAARATESGTVAARAITTKAGVTVTAITGTETARAITSEAGSVGAGAIRRVSTAGAIRRVSTSGTIRRVSTAGAIRRVAAAGTIVLRAVVLATIVVLGAVVLGAISVGHAILRGSGNDGSDGGGKSELLSEHGI